MFPQPLVDGFSKLWLRETGNLKVENLIPAETWLWPCPSTLLTPENAVWGGWKLESHYSLDNGTHVAEIELMEQLKISDFVKGIVGHVEIQEVIKKTPSMQDVFLNVVNNE